MRKCRGFTLVEVLVAMLVMAIMAVMAWQGIDGIVRTRQASEGQVDRMLRLTSVLAQWEQDLSAVQDSVVVPALAFDGATLRVTRRTDAGLQVVAWSLRGLQWLRWAGPPVTSTRQLQEQWMQSLQLLGNETGHLNALTGLADWQVYFFRGNGWSNAQSSGDVAAPVPVAPPGPGASGPQVVQRPRQVLPTGVRLVLALAPDSGFNGTLTRDVGLAQQAQ